MNAIKDKLRPSWVWFREAIIDTPLWYLQGRPVPAPRRVKNAVLAENAPANSTWVETGTYLGQTTQFLSTIARHVYSLEPAPGLFERAKRKFANRPEVTILNESSEEAMPRLLGEIDGPTAFWLDGHYSAGPTYQGSQVTPIHQELHAIEQNLGRLSPISIMIDDIRLFGTDPGYPSIDVLTNWAERHNLTWRIKHDIMIIS